MVIVSAPVASRDERPPTFVVTRDVLEDGQTVASYAERALYECAKTLAEFELIERTTMRVGNRTAPSIMFRWKSRHGSLTQQQVYTEGAEQSVLCLTACARTEHWNTAAPALREIWTSVRLPG